MPLQVRGHSQTVLIFNWFLAAKALLQHLAIHMVHLCRREHVCVDAADSGLFGVYTLQASLMHLLRK